MLYVDSFKRVQIVDAALVTKEQRNDESFLFRRRTFLEYGETAEDFFASCDGMVREASDVSLYRIFFA